jgi:DNA-binding response OmpR family regulator
VLTPGAQPDGPAVLVVEDEFLIAMDLEHLLERNGWRVLGPAATVKEAFRLLDGEAPDVALLDVNLRGEMVTPVAERLRARGIPFVLASAYDGAQLAAMGLAGAAQIDKPINARRLLAALLQAVVP